MTSAAQATVRYALAPDVFVCIADEDLVLLDLTRDKYLALQQEDAEGLASLVRGWPAFTRTLADPAVSSEAHSLAEALRQRGLLTEHLARGKDATPVCIDEPTGELTADLTGARPRARVLDAALVAKCCLTGKWLKRNRSIEQIVVRMRERRQRADFAALQLDRDTAHRLIVLFGSVRTFLLSTHGACLLECIVLLELFAHYGIYPNWIFGVKTRPFAAHCWLQHEDLILNDTIDSIAGYRPIMVV